MWERQKPTSIQPRHVNEGKQSWGYTCAVASRDRLCCRFLSVLDVPKGPKNIVLRPAFWNPFGSLLEEKWALLSLSLLSLLSLSLSFLRKPYSPHFTLNFPKGIQTEPGYCIFTTWIIMEINCSSWVAVSLCPLRSFLTFCVAIFATKMRQT